jgi:hypothetical protein
VSATLLIGSERDSKAAKYWTLESAGLKFSVWLLANWAVIEALSAGLKFSAMDCKNVDAWELESANDMFSVALPKKLLPLLLITSATVMGSVMDCKKLKTWVLESAGFIFSVSVAVKAVPASEANGT